MNPETEKRAGGPGESASQEKTQLRRVLVVDDDPDAAEALAELLSMSGHQVRVATASHEALSLFQSLQPHVAVLDIGLPVMDGYELQSRMRGLPGGDDCIFLALTGYGTRSGQDEGRHAGFAAHLVKPVDLKQLATLIEGSGGPA